MRVSAQMLAPTVDELCAPRLLIAGHQTVKNLGLDGLGMNTAFWVLYRMTSRVRAIAFSLSVSWRSLVKSAVSFGSPLTALFPSEVAPWKASPSGCMRP